MQYASIQRNASFQSAFAENKTLRNTFSLLGLTLIPTVFAVWLGIQMHFIQWFSAHPLLGFLMMLGGSFGLIFAIQANATNSSAIPLTFAFAALMGLMLSVSIEHQLGFRHGAEVVMLSAIGTIAVLAGCSTYALFTKRDFSAFGGFLMGALLALIVLSLVNVFMQVTFLTLLVAFASLILFSALLVFDVQRVVRGGETNYILATLAIYLDILNIFSALMQLFGFSNRD
jgi:modulator of FtsH protease